jgi:hypothetical protein
MPLVVDVSGAAEIFEAVVVAIGEDDGAGSGQHEAFGEAALAQVAGALVHEARRDVDGAARGVVAVVVDDERALAAAAVGVGEDVLIDSAIAVPEIVEGEVRAAGEDVALR